MRACIGLGPGSTFFQAQAAQSQAQAPKARNSGPKITSMALRVGGTVLRGMNALGGRTMTTAHPSVSDSASVPSKPSRSSPEQGTLPKESDADGQRQLDVTWLFDFVPCRVPELIGLLISALRFSGTH